MKLIYLFLLINSLVFGNTKLVMTNKIKKIDKDISTKKEEIKKINSQTETIEERIEEIKNEITHIKSDKTKIEKEIAATLKNMEYGSINLDFSSKELERKEAEFNAKLIAWNRREFTTLSFEEETLLKKQFSQVLYSDLADITYIKNVKEKIGQVSSNMEDEKTKLGLLKNQLNSKINDIAKKEREQKSLIAKLNSEKNKHITAISSLEKEKQRIQKEIENILKNKITPTNNVIYSYSVTVKNLGKGSLPISNGRVTLKFKQAKTKNVLSNGVEISAKLGSPVRSSYGGKVIYNGKIQGLGKVVMVNYGYNLIGVYGNLIHSFVKLDQVINKGSFIGVLGLSIDEKPVLYYETRHNLKPINPLGLY